MTSRISPYEMLKYALTLVRQLNNNISRKTERLIEELLVRLQTEEGEQDGHKK